jgi:hypothetical protein
METNEEILNGSGTAAEFMPVEAPEAQPQEEDGYRVARRTFDQLKGGVRRRLASHHIAALLKRNAGLCIDGKAPRVPKRGRRRAARRGGADEWRGEKESPSTRHQDGRREHQGLAGEGHLRTRNGCASTTFPRHDAFGGALFDMSA